MENVTQQLILSVCPDRVKIPPQYSDMIGEYLKVRVDGYWFAESYKNYLRLLKISDPQKRDRFRAMYAVWDGYYNFVRYNSFPTGLLPIVLEKLKENNIDFKIEKLYSLLNTKDNYELNGIKLRDYQEEAIKNVKEEQRGIIGLPPNAGKTEIALSVIKMFSVPSLFIVHLKELFYQTYKRAKVRLGIEPGLIGDGKYQLSDFMNICMIQTLLKLGQKEFISNSKVVILDEVHHFTGEGNWYSWALKNLRSCIVRIGLSATPFRNNDVSDWKLMGLTGGVLKKISNSFMISSGYSASPSIIFYKVGDKENIDRELSYQRVLDKYVVNNDARNKLIKNIVESYKDKNILICVSRIKHGKNLQKLIPDSIFMYGKNDTEYRQNIIQQFKDRKLRVLISTLLGEGINIVNIEVLILASPFKSLIPVLQRVGRGLRKKEINEVAIIDFIDYTSIYLLKQSYERIKIYKDEEFKIEQKDKLDGV